MAHTEDDMPWEF